MTDVKFGFNNGFNNNHRELKKDRECLHCKNFWDCEGKPRSTERCINFNEREELKGSD